jgi:hypothetical protein
MIRNKRTIYATCINSADEIVAHRRRRAALDERPPGAATQSTRNPARFPRIDGLSREGAQ